MSQKYSEKNNPLKEKQYRCKTRREFYVHPVTTN